MLWAAVGEVLSFNICTFSWSVSYFQLYIQDMKWKEDGSKGKGTNAASNFVIAYI